MRRAALMPSKIPNQLTAGAIASRTVHATHQVQHVAQKTGAVQQTGSMD
jgi:hypothetical protein